MGLKTQTPRGAHGGFLRLLSWRSRAIKGHEHEVSIVSSLETTVLSRHIVIVPAKVASGRPSNVSFAFKNSNARACGRPYRNVQLASGKKHVKLAASHRKTSVISSSRAFRHFSTKFASARRIESHHLFEPRSLISIHGMICILYVTRIAL